MEHLIANSGIQFVSKEVELNPSEPFTLESGKVLRYYFCEMEDFLGGQSIFDLLYYRPEAGVFVPVNELRKADKLVKLPNGREELDETGVPKMLPEEPLTLYSSFTENDAALMYINSLQSFRVKSPIDGRTYIPAFDLLLDHWLPMPMYEKEIDGITSTTPKAWCRMKMSKVDSPDNHSGKDRYRLVWAFDTNTSTDMLSEMRPYFFEGDETPKSFSLCNEADRMFDFFTNQTGGGTPFSEYLTALLGLDVVKDLPQKYKYVAYYIYFVNYLRLSGCAPEVTLYNNQSKIIDVDMVLDIGNSRTCGVLFEEGDFTKAMMLELRDLTFPWKTYDHSFDMRVVFRKADIGNDIVLDEEVFQWKSFVRVGNEASHLVYRSLENVGLSEQTTNYSSPKRYLWDTKAYKGQWEFLTTVDDPFNIQADDKIYIKGLSDLFTSSGDYNPYGMNELSSSYSRSSLMTFAFIEVLQQALMQINSSKFRTKHANVDCRRRLRNLIITCPTAMPVVEQIKLRQCAADAFDALQRCNPVLTPINVIPSPASLKPTLGLAHSKEWSYDEASCCQLVYLYAELAQRYGGEIHKFFEMKGHVRPELAQNGFHKKALTIGSIDIGAGTTDMMICTYTYAGDGCSQLTPLPKFYDSFYLAGDDVLRNIVQNVLIDGKQKDGTHVGSVGSALTARLTRMSNEQLKALPVVSSEETEVYKNKVEEIVRCQDAEQRESLIRALASNLIHDFFGFDSAMMSYKARQCRVDFNTQISVPIAQKMMELLRLKRPSKMYTFEELFGEVKPATFLLDYFAQHFGFRFEELEWRYDPEEVGRIVKATLEPLLKQLSIILYAHHCDILVLAGRPTSLDAITELFIKYIPLSPDRLIRLNEYRVGSWYPFADGQGYFYDQKSVVAVGAMIGYLSSHKGFKGMVMDFGRMISEMQPTAHYMGIYHSRRQQVVTSLLTPHESMARIDATVFPVFLGCKQLDAPSYQARPLYALYNHSTKPSLKITLSRSYQDDMEKLVLEDVTDSEGMIVSKSSVELVQQSLADDGKYWLDKGEFDLSIK